jgi:hypothetical protein
MATTADAGATLLDHKDPGWWEAAREPWAIDPETIAQNDEGMCVLGQLYGNDYGGTLAWLGLAWDDGEQEHGFISEYHSTGDDLSLDWRRIILQRRAMPGVCRFADGLRKAENAAAERAAKAAEEAALPDIAADRWGLADGDPAYIPGVPVTDAEGRHQVREGQGDRP